jgi:hypothetical protein
MRNVPVSLDVFQAIWSAQKPDQDSEDAIPPGVYPTSRSPFQTSPSATSC